MINPRNNKLLKPSWPRKIGFFAGLLLLTLVLGAIFNPVYWYNRGALNDRNMTYAGLAAQDKNSIDVLVIGDSLCMTSFDQSQFDQATGMKAFNASQFALQIHQMYAMFHQAMKRQSPKVVVLEAHTLLYEASHFSVMRGTAEDMAMSLFPVSRFHNIWKHMLPDKLRDKSKDAKSDNGKTGYDPNRAKDFNALSATDNPVPYTGGDAYLNDHTPQPIETLTGLYLLRIKQVCDKHDAKLLLYSAPSALSYNQDGIDQITALAEKYDIPYLDMNHALVRGEVPSVKATQSVSADATQTSISNAIQTASSKMAEAPSTDILIDWNTDTMDAGDHLTKSGAVKTTTYLTDYIMANYPSKA